MTSAIDQILQASDEEKVEVNARLTALELQVDELSAQVAQGIEGLEVINRLDEIKTRIQGIYVPVEPTPPADPNTSADGSSLIAPTQTGGVEV